ncbi:hypothetical protein GCM10022237_40580 [Nocardioides ginsengisoli]|uniref:Gas vesicle protein n=1 Tax=Nocardioides ginsengisoli TaxID=363868 RepID=A0ABW3W5V2_9ACTN
MADAERAPERAPERTPERAEKRPAAKAPAAKRTQPRPSRISGAEAALRGAQQLAALTGRTFEGIVGFAKDGDGWSVEVELLEMRRIPDTTDVLGVYELDLDRTGDLVGYRRVDRYLRGAAGEGER